MYTRSVVFAVTNKVQCNLSCTSGLSNGPNNPNCSVQLLTSLASTNCNARGAALPLAWHLHAPILSHNEEFLSMPLSQHKQHISYRLELLDAGSALVIARFLTVTRGCVSYGWRCGVMYVKCNSIAVCICKHCHSFEAGRTIT